MVIVDGHLDLAWNALQWNRDLLCPVHTTRTREHRIAGPGRGQGTVALPELRRGRVALCFATLLARSTGRAEPDIDYPSPAQAHGVARGQLAYYRALEQEGHVRIVTDVEGLDRHMPEWEVWETDADAGPADNPPFGLVISMESADPILTPGQLREWWEAGVRLIGPAHYGPGRYAGGTGTELGLTAPGVDLLAEMERLGVILDLTHLSDQGFGQALEVYAGPVLASHNNCRALVPHQRQLSDDQLQAVIERDGVIGVAFDAWMLRSGWVKGVTTNERVTIAEVVDHIDHICQLSGSSRHAAIGTDLDGGFGREQSPRDLDTIADLQKLRGLLAQRGYGDPDIAAILHGNWLRLLRQAWARKQQTDCRRPVTG
jgi:membrane dipeptidase